MAGFRVVAGVGRRLSALHRRVGAASREIAAAHLVRNGVGVLLYQSAVAPVFADDTGDAQSWINGTQITPLTVPAATGKPTPTYAVVGSLPAGIQFNAATRQLTGTPTAGGSGTIRIRATNSAGIADWTVAYTVRNRVALTLPSSVSSVSSSEVSWAFINVANPSLGTGLSADGSTLYLWVLLFRRATGQVGIQLTSAATGTSGVGPDFSAQMEASGTITFRSSAGQELVVTGIGDSTEPYRWTPSNAAAVRTFATHIAGLSNRALTVTFDDGG